MKKILFVGLILFVTISLFAQKKDLTNADIWLSSKFIAKVKKEIVSSNDGKNFFVLENDSINIYSYIDGNKIGTLICATNLELKKINEKFKIEGFKLSNDEKKVLIYTNDEKIYRRSSKSDYYVYNVIDKSIIPLSEGGKQQMATFSPKTDKIAFVRENNIFIKDLIQNKEVQVTNDGKFNFIINGSSDWVYEEELEITRTFDWNADGTKLAFMRFDESNVKQYPMQMWGELYPETYNYKYPKAGEDNSIVTVHVYDVTNEKTTNVDLGENTDQYIPRMNFTPKSNILSIIRMNRLQNKMELIHYDLNTAKTDIVYTDENKSYIDLSHFSLEYTKKGNTLLITSESDGWNHLYLVDYSKKESKLLTKGNYEVVDFIGFDETNNLVYYISTEDAPVERQLYSLSLKNLAKTKITRSGGIHNVDFNSNFTYYIDSYSNLNTPPVISVCKSNGTEVRVIIDNAKVKDLISEYGFVKNAYFSFKTSTGVELHGTMMKPDNMVAGKKYPVLMTFYGGPGSQEIGNTWNGVHYIWHQLLVQKGYIVVTVDGRGTGYRGEAFKKSTYLNLGEFEVEDQIETGKYLATLNYIDSTRIGVWGWSFGGYLSTLCMTKGANVFKTGIAVAPVTNWRFYDNIYTERFLRKPQDNPKGYDDNSPINFVKQLKGNYLLVHGTADDNVHVQNSFMLIDALVKNNKQFDMQMYTNKNHGIYGGYTRFHLYTKMTDYLLKNL